MAAQSGYVAVLSRVRLWLHNIDIFVLVADALFDVLKKTKKIFHLIFRYVIPSHKPMDWALSPPPSRRLVCGAPWRGWCRAGSSGTCWVCCTFADRPWTRPCRPSGLSRRISRWIWSAQGNWRLLQTKIKMNKWRRNRNSPCLAGISQLPRDRTAELDWPRRPATASEMFSSVAECFSCTMSLGPESKEIIHN